MKNSFTFYENTILNNITLDAYDIVANTKFEKITEVNKIFYKEYVHHNNKHLPKELNFKGWLQGLPSVLTIPFMNSDILQNAEEYFGEFPSEEEEDEFIEEYWHNCAKAFFTLLESL